MRPTKAQIAALKRRDPALGAVIKHLPPFPDLPVIRGTYFHVLARSIIYQQLATRAATTIYGRVRRLGPGPRFPTPAQVLALPDERFRSAGLSGNKTKALRDLAARILSGALPLRRIAHDDDEEVIRRLTTVWGIGEWTAHMYLMFKLLRPDVWPVGDLGVRAGYAKIHGLDEQPTAKQLEPLADAHRPWRSVAAFYCWRALDTELS